MTTVDFVVISVTAAVAWVVVVATGHHDLKTSAATETAVVAAPQVPVPVKKPTTNPPATVAEKADNRSPAFLTVEGIKAKNPNLTDKEAEEILNQANRLDRIEHVLDEVVVQQRQITDRLNQIVEGAEQK